MQEASVWIIIDTALDPSSPHQDLVDVRVRAVNGDAGEGVERRALVVDGERKH